MQIKSEHTSPQHAVLTPSGRMDVESSPVVRQAILDLVDSGVQYLVVNLIQVEFMDSSGLSALVSGMKALRRSGGMLTVCQANAQIRTALRLTMLDRVFPMYEDIPAAFEAAEKEQPPEA